MFDKVACMKKMKVFPILLILIVIVTGCVGQSNQGNLSGSNNNIDSTPGLKEFNVVISHTSYSPNRFEVNKGDTVRFSALAAPGTGTESGLSHNHGMTIDEYNINQAVTSEKTPTTIEFLADKSGTFSIYCKTCWDGPYGRGHPDIRATLIVE